MNHKEYTVIISEHKKILEEKSYYKWIQVMVIKYFYYHFWQVYFMNNF